MGNCHFKTDFDAENITGKYYFKQGSSDWSTH